MSQSSKDRAHEVAAKQSVANPSMRAIGPIFTPLYLAGVPLTSYLTRPGGLLQQVGTKGNTISDRLIPAMSAIYVFVAFGATGAFSAAGQAMAREEGLDNDEPRAHIHNLRGLPLRLRSAHYGLIENFPAYALAAALTQAVNPRDQQLINLLGFHILLKVVVFYASYIAGFPPTRTLSHVLATSAVINLLYRLAVNA